MLEIAEEAAGRSGRAATCSRRRVEDVLLLEVLVTSQDVLPHLQVVVISSAILAFIQKHSPD